MGTGEGAPVWIDGRLEPHAGVSAPDLGPGVFETLRFEHGVLYFVEEHLARLRRGAARLGIPWPLPWDPRAALRTFALALELDEAAVRLTLSRASAGARARLAVRARPIEPLPRAGVRVRIASEQRRGDDPLAGCKSTSRELQDRARAEARAQGAWEALLLDPEDRLVEGSVSNLFLLRSGELCTPPLESGCLPGIVRGALLAELGREPLRDARGRVLPACERALGLQDLLEAQEVFLTNSIVRVAPVIAVEGSDRSPSALPGAEGEVARAVRMRLEGLEREGRWEVCRRPT